MKVSSLIGMASAVVRSKKFKIVLVGLQLGFLTMKYLSEKKGKPASKKKKKKKKLLIGN
ncbi:hypothetical protein [Kriegella aquimaris]|uniref:Uncharacterized protein n=1 Tax=Kriegella aquimaris TaxID=192904 RepID=A0A1G9RMP1_9FLAO|nr:hypothetical protein [Kriegella aquimaris]SDM24454.1 hypothetical protein SAMN04488514_106205 [Kriegella aquimaris]